jgi:hypothetical protein
VPTEAIKLDCLAERRNVDIKVRVAE